MITETQALNLALKRSQYIGVILYEGPSLLDGQPIVVIANKIIDKSKNTKTGAMVQTYILRSAIDPMAAIKTGADISICGDCRHRPDPVTKTRTCYVNLAKSVTAVYGAYQRGRYARPNQDYDLALIPDLLSGLMVRIGTYGDPAAVPAALWTQAIAYADGHNGYTHQWRKPEYQDLKSICMASVDTVAEAYQAIKLGWRYFRVRQKSSPIDRAIESICPAAKEAGAKVQCTDCRACGGLASQASRSKVIEAHGIQAARF